MPVSRIFTVPACSSSTCRLSCRAESIGPMPLTSRLPFHWLSWGGLRPGDLIRIGAVVGGPEFDIAGRTRGLDSGFLGVRMSGHGIYPVALEGVPVRLGARSGHRFRRGRRDRLPGVASRTDPSIPTRCSGSSSSSPLEKRSGCHFLPCRDERITSRPARARLQDSRIWRALTFL